MGQREKNRGSRVKTKRNGAARCHYCGDTVGDPFKDTSSVALNPVIKFSTLFGLLAVELAVQLTSQIGGELVHILAAIFFLVSFFFVYRSFYGMRIKSAEQAAAREREAAQRT